MKRFISIVVLLMACVCGFSQVAPSQLSSEDIDDISAHLYWQCEADDIDFFEIEYQVALSEEVFLDTTSQTDIELMGLLPGMQYLWKVRYISIDGDTSLWSNTAAFYTIGFSSDCADIENLIVGDMNNDKLLLQWEANDSIVEWEVVMGEIGSNPFTNEIRHRTLNYEYPFFTLYPYEMYQFAVRSLCNPTISNWKYIYAKYLDDNAIYQLPLQIDFSDSVQNKKIGLISSQHNPWHINNGLLFVSNDNGVSECYSSENEAVSYAYIDFHIPEDAVSFYIDFKYLASLSGEHAGMKVYITAQGIPLSINTLPNQIFQVGDTSYYNSEQAWKQEHIELPSNYIGSDSRIVFAWFNDSLASGEGSIALDDIYLTARYCAVPDTLICSNITTSSAQVSWNMTMNQSFYNLQYKKQSDSTWVQVNNIENNYIINNLDPDTYYQFRVQADCITEQSFYSDTCLFHTHALANIPQGISYTVTDNSALITWQNDPTAEYWIISYKPNDYNYPWTQDTANNNQKTLPFLAQNTQYVLRMATVNTLGDTSLWSDLVYFTTLCTANSDYPFTLQYIMEYNSVSGYVNAPTCWNSEDNNLYSVKFDLSQTFNPVLSFAYSCSSTAVVSVQTDDTQEPQNLAILSGNTDFEEVALSLSNYNFSQEAVIIFTCVDVHNMVTTLRIQNFTIQEGCPSARDIVLDSVSSSYAKISWQQEDEVSNYSIVLKDEDFNTISITSSMLSSCQFFGLEANTLYNVVIYSYCDQTASLDSAEFMFYTTEEVFQCPVPEDFTAIWWQSKGDETLYAQWSDEQGVSQWEVVYKQYYAVAWDTAIVRINPVFTLRNLDPNQKYQIKVRGICTDGDTSDFTETLEVEIGDSYLEDVVEWENLILYPNPTKDIIKIQTQNSSFVDISLVDSQAKIIKSWEKLPQDIDLSGLKNGLYLLIYHDNRGNTFSQKIIKQ